MATKNVLKWIVPSALIIGIVGFVSIHYSFAQQAGNDAQPNIPLAPENNKKNDQPNTGVDPELVQVNEPDSVDLDPSLASANDDNKTKTKIDPDNVNELKQALGGDDKKSENSGLVMPKLVGANIPTIPVNLLFPQGQTQQVANTKIEELSGTSVLMLGTDRSTGQSLKFRIPVGSAVKYQNINIAVSACYKSRPDSLPESWAYVDVVDMGEPQLPQVAVLAQRNRAKMREAEGPHRLRKGWIIASSPYVTAIDHPVYNISLLACEGGQTVAPVTTTDSTKTDNKDQNKG